EPAVTGDVEVDIEMAGWHAHGHDTNPNFKNVILHVIYEAHGTPSTSSARHVRRAEPVLGAPPAVSIRNQLDAPVDELNLWLKSEDMELLPEHLRGQCSSPLRELSQEKLRELLLQAAQTRFRGKAAQFQARARQVG